MTESWPETVGAVLGQDRNEETKHIRRRAAWWLAATALHSSYSFHRLIGISLWKHPDNKPGVTVARHKTARAAHLDPYLSTNRCVASDVPHFHV